MGGALLRRPAGPAAGHGAARPEGAEAEADQAAGRHRDRARADDAGAGKGAGRRRRRPAAGPRAGREGRRRRGRGQGAARGRLSRGAAAYARDCLPRTRHRPAGADAQPQPEGRRPGAGRHGHAGRLPGGPARRGHRLGQDRGLSRGGRRGARRRPGRPGAGAAARDRPDPGGHRPVRGPLRRAAGRMALGRSAAPPPAGLGGRGHRPGADRRRGPFGAVPAVPQPAPDRRRRGARRLVQTGGGLHLPGPRPRRGPGQPGEVRRGAGLGHAVAGKPVERRAGPLPLAQAGLAPRGVRTAGRHPDRHARDAARARPLAVAAADRGDEGDLRPQRTDAAVPKPPGLRAAGPLPRLRRADEGPGHRQLAGRAPLHRPAGLPSDRLFHAQAGPLPALRRAGQPGLDRPRRGAGRGGGALPVPRGARGGVLVRHGVRRRRRPLDRQGDDRRRDRRAGGHPGGGQGPRLPAADPGGRGRRRPRPARRRPAGGRADLPAAGPGQWPGRSARAAGPGHAADLRARACRDAGAGGAGSRRLPRRRDVRPRAGRPAAVRPAGGDHLFRARPGGAGGLCPRAGGGRAEHRRRGYLRPGGCAAGTGARQAAQALPRPRRPKRRPAGLPVRLARARARPARCGWSSTSIPTASCKGAGTRTEDGTRPRPTPRPEPARQGSDGRASAARG